MENQPTQPGIELVGPPAEIFFTLKVTRADTGKIEYFDMIGHVVENPTTEGEVS
jgi:hypothetical protein